MKKWSFIQHEFLKLLINKYGANSWKRISFLFTNKTSEDCMKKWNTNDNSIFKKLNWDDQEDKKLIHLHVHYSYKLQIISFFFKKKKPICLFRIKFIRSAKYLLILRKKTATYFPNTLSNVNTDEQITYKSLNVAKIKFLYTNKYQKKFLQILAQFSIEINSKIPVVVFLRKYRIIYRYSVTPFRNVIFNPSVYVYIFYTVNFNKIKKNITLKYLKNLKKKTGDLDSNIIGNFYFFIKSTNENFYIKTIYKHKQNFKTEFFFVF